MNIPRPLLFLCFAFTLIMVIRSSPVCGSTGPVLTDESSEAGIPRIAVLRDDLPGSGTRKIAAVMTALKTHGMSPALISFQDISAPDLLKGYDVLILDGTIYFSSAAQESFFKFVRNGGDLVLLGGDGFIHPKSFDLPAFSKYEPFRMDDLREIALYPGQNILGEPVSVKGSFSGISAVGVGIRNQSMFYPLLEGRDVFGRNRGWAAGILVHYSGEYKDSNWLLFGVSSDEFYESPDFAKILETLLKKTNSGLLASKAAKSFNERLSAPAGPAAPAAAGFVHLSKDGQHLLDPAGKRLFLTGCNYHRSLEMTFWGRDAFDFRTFEDDFRKCRDAGINSMRVAAADPLYANPEQVKSLLYCARKYGVYLLISVRWGTEDRNSEDLIANAEAVAKIFKDEPMVLGYDLQNEPYPWVVGTLTYNGEKSPILKLDAYERFAGKYNREWVDENLETFARVPEWLPLEDRKNILAFVDLWNKALDGIHRTASSTFPGLGEKLEVAPEWKEVLDAGNDTFDLWIRMQREAIRKHDKNHLITVGYNSICSSLPTNEQLDFVSQHVYERPSSIESVLINVTAFDRLKRIWKDKPITFGEFGYSNGIPMPDGSYLDFHTAAVGEMITFLYPLAHDYDGSMKWMLTDWHWVTLNWGRDIPHKTYESYFGFYWYDGTPEGRPKPVCHALKFLREYIDETGEYGGNLEIKSGDNQIGTVYLYQDENALFIGDSEYHSPYFTFKSKKPANVMLTWYGNSIRLISSCDVRVNLTPSRYIPQLTAKEATISGKHGGLNQKGNALIVDLLEGEKITLHK